MNKRENIAPRIQTWPAWANWCGLDPAGFWVFYENEPITTADGRMYDAQLVAAPAVQCYRDDAQKRRARRLTELGVGDQG